MNFLKPVEPFIITSRFGNRIHPITHTIKFHNGIDLKGSTGQPVRAIKSGIVENSYYNSTGGNQIVLKHNNNYKSGYAHLNDMYVANGQRINKGDIIGTIGATGKVTGPHLHFTIKDPQNKYIDPGNKDLYKRIFVDLLEFLAFPIILYIIHKATKK